MSAGGRIQNTERFKQLLCFDSLYSNKKMPSDIDAIIEYKNKAYILFEVKFQDKALSLGQKILIERMVRRLYDGGARAIAAVCEHDVENENDFIDLGSCIIREVYASPEFYWRKPRACITAKELVAKCIPEWFTEEG
jgi:hypothetical protein